MQFRAEYIILSNALHYSYTGVLLLLRSMVCQDLSYAYRDTILKTPLSRPRWEVLTTGRNQALSSPWCSILAGRASSANRGCAQSVVNLFALTTESMTASSAPGALPGEGASGAARKLSSPVCSSSIEAAARISAAASHDPGMGGSSNSSAGFAGGGLRCEGGDGTSPVQQHMI